MALNLVVLGVVSDLTEEAVEDSAVRKTTAW
jgi:uncharacterized membrane protein